MDYKLRAQELLDEWQVVKNAKPKHNAVNLQLEKDWLDKWSHLLQAKLLWSDDANELAETVYQFENRLNSHKDKVVLEILQHGPI
jgi:hypothetical protein